MKSTDRVRYNYYSIDCACVSIEFITKSQCMDGKWIAFGHSEGRSNYTPAGVCAQELYMRITLCATQDVFFSL